MRKKYRRPGFPLFRSILIERLLILEKLKRRLQTMASERATDDEAFLHLQTIKSYAQDIVDCVSALEEMAAKELQDSKRLVADRSKHDKKLLYQFYAELQEW